MPPKERKPTKEEIKA
jgi:tetratricopeptide (TPR) repeat protein